MMIRGLKDCSEIAALDGCVLRELFNSDKQELSIRYSLAHAKVGPLKSTCPHKLKNSEVYYIIQGKGIMHIDDESAQVGPGDAIYIPPGARQYMTNTRETELEFLCIVDPAWRAQDEQKC